MKPYTAIFDFNLYPYALGDTFTWNVRTAMAAHEAGAKNCRVVAFADSTHPHCPFQIHPTSEQFELFQCEIQPAFYTHPCATSFHLFHDRKEFDSYLNFLVAQRELSPDELTSHKQNAANRNNFKAVSDHFAGAIGSHHAINEFYKKHGFIPKLKEVLGARYDAEALIAAQERDTQLVCVQFRMRSLDQWHPGGSERDADFDAWYDLIVRCGREMPRVKFVLLGRLQEKHLSVLALPNVIAPRALGLNLAHEISLFLRSDFFLGSSSGFAQLAYFSDVPYRISNVPHAARKEWFCMPAESTRVPFARDNQLLLNGPETADGLFAALAEGLAHCPPRNRESSLSPTYRKFQTTSRLFLNAAQGQHETASRLLPITQQAIQLATDGKTKESLGLLLRINETLLRAHRTGSIRKITVGRMMRTFNQSELLDQAFTSMAEQTVPADEIIVIDDGSTDNSAAKIREWGAQSPTHKTLFLSENSGAHSAINIGLEHVTTDFFSPVLADEHFYSTHIEKISLLAQSYPRAGLATFRSLHQVVGRNQCQLGPQLFPSSRFVEKTDAELVLRHNQLWTTGIAWNTEAYNAERNYDWRLRWIAPNHVADVLAFRHGFCYVAEPLMEYNLQPQSHFSDGTDLLRHSEALLSSVRDWCSPTKQDIFSAGVRSGFFGLRDNAEISILAVLNGSWTDHGRPFLLIIQGIFELLDQFYQKAGIPPATRPRFELNNSRQIISGYNRDYNEKLVFDSLIPFCLSVVAQTPLNNPLVGFYAGYLVRVDRIKDAQELLRTHLGPGKRCKAVLRVQAQIATKTEGLAAGDRAWRGAFAANPADVWFAMEYVRVLLGRGQTDAAHDLARELCQRDPGADVLKELQEILPKFTPTAGIPAVSPGSGPTRNQIDETPETENGEVFSRPEVESITILFKTWQADPTQIEKRTELLVLRRELSAFLLEVEPDGLANLFAATFGQVYRLLLRSGLQHESIHPEDTGALATILPRIKTIAGNPPDFRALLAFALFRPAHESPAPFPPESVPRWFWDDYVAYNLTLPQGIAANGEAGRYLVHLLAWAKDISARITANPKDELTVKLAQTTARQISLAPFDSTTADVHQLVTLRTEIMNFTQPLARVS